jgi:hypothetical protein
VIGWFGLENGGLCKNCEPGEKCVVRTGYWRAELALLDCHPAYICNPNLIPVPRKAYYRTDKTTVDPTCGQSEHHGMEMRDNQPLMQRVILDAIFNFH